MEREDAFSEGVDEENRPLLKEGKDVTKVMTQILLENKFQVGEIISSPFLRALETAEIIKKTAHYDKKITISEALLPERNFDDFLDVLKNRKESHPDKGIVVVGHEPNLSHLISTLLGGRKTFIELKKSAVAVIEVESVSDAAAGNGLLRALLPPKFFKD